jgi:hypothetical protein
VRGPENAEGVPRPDPVLRRAVLRLLVIACLVLIGWIVVLAVTLPHRYTADNWDVAWAGFDVALLLGLATTAWAIARRRQVAVVAAVVTATLLVVDAWFDVTTAATYDDRVLAVASALLAELPLAALLLLLARRLLRLSISNARERAGLPAKVPPLYRLPLLLLDESTDDRGPRG